MTSDRDTIFALSSGRPPAAIAVIRVSGPRAGAALERLIGRVPQPRRASLAQVRDPATHHVIDEGLALWFPGPNSATGEDVAELHVHGGRAVIAAVTAVEGLADLVAAETEAQRRQAYQQLRGLLGDRAESWRQRLIEALALVEAGIDFSDEEDVPKDMMSRALELIRPLGEEISKAGARQGERLREGLRVAIAGPPNAGKSTLFNRLARREAAIVSPFPGTTRDVLELHLDLGGYPVTVLDTAGMRETSDPIEREGVRRASEQAASADLVLWVTDVTEMKWPKFSARCALRSAPNAAAWLVVNKTDLLTEKERKRIESMFAKDENVNLVSSSIGTGVDGLVNALSGFAERFFTPEPALVTRERQRAHLRETVLALERAKCAAQEGREEIMAEHLRLASRALGKLLGRVDVEDVLDVIFRDFCVGK